MAELDPNIVLKAFATPQLDIAGTMQAAQERKRQMMLQQRQDSEYAQQQAAQARQLQDAADERDVVRMYGTDETGARQKAFGTGNAALVAKLDAMGDAGRKRAYEVSQHTAPLLLSLKRVPPQQRGQAFAQIIPQLQQAGFGAADIQRAGQDLSDAALDQHGVSAMTIADYTAANKPVVVNGHLVTPQGQSLYDAPEPTRYVTTPAGSISTPISGPGMSGGQGKASVEALLPAIVQQESRGNYSAINRGTGAMGAYQVMPETAKTLAGRLGLPWRPELMTAATADGRQYQDAIGHAAVSEAVQASGGDPAVAAAYYHGGSDQSKWGPKTRQYAQDVTARLGGGGPRTIVGPPKAQNSEQGGKAPSGYRYTPDGTLEPIPGGPADKAKVPRPISATQEEQMSKQFDIWSSLYRANTTWNPKYAGNTVTGGLETTAQRLLGTGTPGQAEWWSDFRTTDNLIRNSMFGSALTDNEKKAYEATTISESTDPKIAADRLNKRGNIITGALRRRARALVANGHDINAVREMFGNEPMIVDGLETALPGNRQQASAPSAPQQQGAPARITNDADFAKLPSGALFIGPDGHVRRKP